MLELISSLDPTVLVSMIGVLSVVLSAGIGALISRWHTSSQFREELQKLRLERLNEQSDLYLKNAREQIGTVYVPLSSSLAILKGSFQNFVYQGKTEELLVAFTAQIDQFIEDLQALEMRGATAFVTTDLEDVIIKFAVFLRASKDASEPVVDVTYNFRVGIGGFSTNQSGTTQRTSSKVARAKFSASISVAEIDADVRVSDIIQAPIETDEFQARFERDTYQLSVLIKEVTLGSAARVV